MKHGSLIVVAAFLCMSALADETVNRSIDADDDSYIEIYNTAGSVSVNGWSRKSIEIKGTLGDAVEELIVEKDGKDILIKVKVPNRHRGDIDADLEIKVPAGSTLEVTGVSTDIEVDGVRGAQSLSTVSGDIDTRGVGDDVEAGSVSGDVNISGDGATGSFEAATVSGDITIKGVSGDVDAESVSGDIDVIGGVFDDAHFETVNGDLTFHAGLSREGELSMESVNGTVDVEFAKEVLARFDIETFNGNIRNCFGPKPERTSRYSPGLELGFTTGDGKARVNIETLNGSVNLCHK